MFCILSFAISRALTPQSRSVFHFLLFFVSGKVKCLPKYEILCEMTVIAYDHYNFMNFIQLHQGKSLY